MYSIGELRVGKAIILDDAPYLITYAQHSKQARAGGVCRTKLKNLIDGTIIPKTFQGNDKIKPADTGYKKAQYLYNDGEDYHFMDNESYEQFRFSAEDLEDQVNFLVDDSEVDVLTFNDKPIGVMLPPKVELEVVQTDPGVKGDTASGGSKPATTNTGFIVQVPLFIKRGDLIRVNTESGEYVERV
jgi:elongation factor P